jgi:hypothetical protein
MTPSRPQSSAEELANSLTHGLGALLALVVGPVLIVVAARTDDIWRVVATTIYATTLALLYSASSLYHAMRSPRAKKIFQRIDHASIYLLIAGTYTPFTLITLRGPWGWTLFGVVWGLAALGVAFKGAFGDRLPVISVLHGRRVLLCSRRASTVQPRGVAPFRARGKHLAFLCSSMVCGPHTAEPARLALLRSRFSTHSSQL